MLLRPSIDHGTHQQRRGHGHAHSRSIGRVAAALGGSAAGSAGRGALVAGPVAGRLTRALVVEHLGRARLVRDAVRLPRRVRESREARRAVRGTRAIRVGREVSVRGLGREVCVIVVRRKVVEVRHRVVRAHGADPVAVLGRVVAQAVVLRAVRRERVRRSGRARAVRVGHLGRVLEGEAAGEYLAEVVAQQPAGLAPRALRLVLAHRGEAWIHAAVLGQHDRDGHAVVGEVRQQLRETIGVGQRRHITVAVLVRVEPVPLGVLVLVARVRAAVVVLRVELAVVLGGVRVGHHDAHGDAAHGGRAAADEGAHVSDELLLARGVGGGVVHQVVHLVAGAEAQRVVILGELGDDLLAARLERARVAGRVLVHRDGAVLAGGAQVHERVHAILAQLAHEVVVRLGRVHGVQPHGVGARLREVGDVVLPDGAVVVREEVVVVDVELARVGARVVVHALDGEVVARVRVEHLVVLDHDGVRVRAGQQAGGRRQRDHCRERLRELHAVSIERGPPAWSKESRGWGIRRATGKLRNEHAALHCALILISTLSQVKAPLSRAGWI
ncbi:hypothetical protein ON010_g148 [Phytophthora cinnamomi]|nr:hypothetical protein ON010_g148 [Phytophthora cinnamomi]